MITKKKLEIVDVCLLNLDTFNDERGSFSVTYTDEINKVLGINTNWIQENESLSHKNVFRGLHFQKKRQQNKILIVAQGKISDFCLDLRKKSPSFGKIFKFTINKNSILYIPKGFAHGYKSLKDNTILIYLLSELRFKKFERTIDPFEKQFKIDLNKRTILSKKDKKGMSLEYFKKNIKTL